MGYFTHQSDQSTVATGCIGLIILTSLSLDNLSIVDHTKNQQDKNVIKSVR